MKGCDIEFEKKNGNKTTPKREWAIVVKQKPLLPCEAGHGRVIPKINILMQLDITQKAQLLEIEVIALVLYTGPMVRTSPCHSLPTKADCVLRSSSCTTLF